MTFQNIKKLTIKKLTSYHSKVIKGPPPQNKLS